MTSLECRKAVVGDSPTNDGEIRRMAAALWHQKGIVVINPDELNNDFDSQAVKNAAAKLYGKRG